nr:hypothetical protein [Bacillus sp. YC2]
MKWYKASEIHRFEQPAGKYYSFGEGPECKSETEKLKAENRYLKQQIEEVRRMERNDLGKSRKTHPSGRHMPASWYFEIRLLSLEEEEPGRNS